MAGQMPLWPTRPPGPQTEAYLERVARRQRTELDELLAHHAPWGFPAPVPNGHGAAPDTANQDSLRDCSICLDDLTVHGDKTVAVHHQWKLCWDCLRQLFERAAAAEEDHPAKMDGYFILHKEQYANILGDDLIKRYKEMGDRKKVLPVNRVFCSDPCGQYVGGIIRDAADNMQVIGTCKDALTCGKIWCLKCGEHLPDKAAALDHSGCSFDFAAKVKQQEDALKGLTRGVEYQLCPNCNRAEQLTEGCSHMSCPCGQGYCYDCGSDEVSHDAAQLIRCQRAQMGRAVPGYLDRDMDYGTDYDGDLGSDLYGPDEDLQDYGGLMLKPAEIAASDEVYRTLGLTPRHRRPAAPTAAATYTGAQAGDAQLGATRDPLAATTGPPGRVTNVFARLAARRRRRDLGPPSPRTQPARGSDFPAPAAYHTYQQMAPPADQATAYQPECFGDRRVQRIATQPPLSAQYAANLLPPQLPQQPMHPLTTAYPIYQGPHNPYPLYTPHTYPTGTPQQTIEQSQVLRPHERRYLMTGLPPLGAPPPGTVPYLPYGYMHPTTGYDPGFGERRNAMAPPPGAAAYPWRHPQTLPASPPLAPEGTGGREFWFEDQLRGPGRQSRSGGGMEMDDEDETPL